MAKGKARGGAEAAAKRDEELRQTMERLEEGVRGVFESARYRRYLAVMSRFHSYSANNCLLIAMQRPDATLVAGYRAWQDKFGRQVRKGERGMRILSPVVVKAKGEGDDVGEARDGSAGDGPRRRLAGFRLATVFDVSQTEGRELPTLGVDELTGGVARYEAAMRAVSEISRYPVSFEDVPGGAKGFFSRSEPKRIVIQKGMSQAQTLKTAIHELAHSVMHDFEPKGGGDRLAGPRDPRGPGRERRLRRLELAWARHRRLQLRVRGRVERGQEPLRAEGLARRDTRRGPWHHRRHGAEDGREP